MTKTQALEKVRELVLNRITRTQPYVSDDGILGIVDDCLFDDESSNGTEPHDALVAARKLLTWHKTLISGDSNIHEIDDVIAKIDTALESLRKADE